VRQGIGNSGAVVVLLVVPGWGVGFHGQFHSSIQGLDIMAHHEHKLKLPQRRTNPASHRPNDRAVTEAQTNHG
jgi:hypothetical protein